MKFYVLTRDESTEGYAEKIKSAGKVYFKDVGFLVNYLFSADEGELSTEDHLIPSHDAPHILAQVVIKLLEKEGHRWKLIDFPATIGTPYEMELERGIKAVSFAKEDCPDDCVEDIECPAIGAKRTWDMGKTLKNYSERHRLCLISFSCSHLVRSVFTIAMKDIVRSWLDIKNAVAKCSGGPQWPPSICFLIATHSNCHGIAALISI